MSRPAEEERGPEPAVAGAEVQAEPDLGGVVFVFELVLVAVPIAHVAE